MLCHLTNIVIFVGGAFSLDMSIFGMKVPFISSSEAKNAYFVSGELNIHFLASGDK